MSATAYFVHCSSNAMQMHCTDKINQSLKKIVLICREYVLGRSPPLIFSVTPIPLRAARVNSCALLLIYMWKTVLGLQLIWYPGKFRKSKTMWYWSKSKIHHQNEYVKFVSLQYQCQIKTESEMLLLQCKQGLISIIAPI